MTETAETYIDKSAWQRGEWDDEPDRLEWRSEKTPGLALLIVRSPSTGSLCGYVGVPPGHPWHGKGCGWDDDGIEAEVHGGLNYAAKCQEGGRICHVPRAGESPDVWWLGFDCGHAWDISPAFSALPGFSVVSSSLGESYKTIAYVRHQVERLAAQAVEAVAS